LTVINGPKYRASEDDSTIITKLALKSLVQVMGLGSQDNAIREQLRTLGILGNALTIVISLFKSLKRAKQVFPAKNKTEQIRIFSS
jgi:hypothetical protein